MTANAMQSDRDNCAAAGMNDFIIKPIEVDALWRTLLKWYRPPQQAPEQVPAQKHTQDLSGVLLAIEGLNVAKGIQLCMGKETLYVSILRKYLAGQKNVVAELRAAIAAQDSNTAARLAHTLKSTSTYAGAEQVQELAGQIEQAFKDIRTGEDIKALVDALDLAITPLMLRLEEALG